MQKITPHLWFDKEAKDAAEFYTSAFPDSEISSVRIIRDTPSGDCDIVSFKLAGHPFMAISAGPYFKINPAISFFVNFDPSRDSNARENLDKLWGKLSEGGTALMPLDKYPFSEHYGWVQDKYGVSWQLMLSRPEGEPRPFIVPSLLFAGNVAGKAEEALNFYGSVFKDSRKGNIARYPANMGPEKEGTVMYSDFMIEDTWLAAMDSSYDHKFAFNEAVSFIVNCETQEEIDYYWEKLSADPKAEQCGWLKDKYGLSWQITPDMDKWLASPDDEKSKRATQAMLKMKKIIIAELENA